ncbi:hypothetical protein GCM10011504_10770 [Siccirubricoccus deserti]|uniref:HTTM domain-containing protein n=1 Tax=Siccirubricoccus deserti TaxID=2013562 RepID=A0A9X0UC23_9PROT|nr:hypothetical protein [Siccirubricoccus deserti]MBC4014694.1 hypothetical protein [Siccirubricoccus deserti]GGC34279.1 hypothetical protein GCM10011504_10770 [Siccirubricoccus deserti]
MYSSRLPAQTLRIPSIRVSLPLVLVLLSLLGYLAAKKVTFFMANRSELHGFALVVFCCVAALPFTAIRYADFPRLLRVVVRGIGIIVLVQVLFDAFGPVPPAPNIVFGEANAHALFFRWGACIGVAAGIAAMWRPIFLLPLFYYYIAWRLLIGPRTGIWVTDTDYLAMLDAGAFAVIGGILAITVTSDWTLQRLSWLRAMLQEMPAAVLRQKAAGLIWAVVVGAHLGNYFCSGVAKLMAGEHQPWTWLLQNPTQTAIVIGLERGDNPLATFPTLLQFSWDAISEFGLAFNFFVLGAQLLAPLAILRKRWLLFFTLLFDVFHIGVYMTLGALFHFWIAINLIVYTSAWRMPENAITPMMKAVCVATVLFGHTVFYTNWLGWLDGAKLASPQFFALTKDGREVWMPAVYYGIYSYTIAQAATYVPPDHFSFRIGGNNKNLTDWQDATSCGPRVMAHQATGSTLGAVERLVRETHDFMLRHPAIKAWNLYYLYPHHMQPNPGVFREFNRLSLDEIIGYKYVVESVCLTLRDGQLQRDVRKREEFTFDVRANP